MLLGMQQLLLASFWVAGTLMGNLPSLAQLSTDTSTFSGAISAVCSFNGLEENTQMNYQAFNNSLFGIEDFTISTNVPLVRLNISSVTTNSEAPAANGATILAVADLHQSQSGVWRRVAGSTKNTSETRAPSDYSQDNNLRITPWITTNNPINGVYQLMPGNYSYSVTISCLL